MNEQAVNKVITDFAIENANLRIQNAELRAELEQFKKEKEGDA